MYASVSKIPLRNGYCEFDMSHICSEVNIIITFIL